MRSWSAVKEINETWRQKAEGEQLRVSLLYSCTRGSVGMIKPHF
jgi:hypothetical protein